MMARVNHPDRLESFLSRRGRHGPQADVILCEPRAKYDEKFAGGTQPMSDHVFTEDERRDMVERDIKADVDGAYTCR